MQQEPPEASGLESTAEPEAQGLDGGCPASVAQAETTLIEPAQPEIAVALP